MELSLVLVHYRTPELLGPCLQALAQSVAAMGLAGRVEALVVDNGGGPREIAAPTGLAVELVDAGSNRGFAGGVNLGVSRSSGRTVVVMNPDVEVEPTCLGCLLTALDSGYDVVGPRFHWDREGRLVLPPTEIRSRSAELRRRLAVAGGAPEATARVAWRQHARRHWDAVAPVRSFELSGALLAMRRSSFDRFGPFDESYRLYFEETEWLRRVRQGGGRAAYVPAARARHAFARASGREPAAATWFAESAQHFARSSWGDWFVERLARLDLRIPELPDSGTWPEQLHRSGRAAWIEISPSPAGFPAAAERVPAAEPGTLWLLPPDLAGSLAGSTTLFAREVDDEGREHGRARLEVSG